MTTRSFRPLRPVALRLPLLDALLGDRRHVPIAPGHHRAALPGDRRHVAVVLADREAAAPGVERWCIFDNTTLGAATGNALSLASLLAD